MLIDDNGFDDDGGDDDHDDEDSYDGGGYMVMVMVIVKVDGEGDCGDDSGCDVEGVAWRKTRSSITISRTWPGRKSSFITFISPL